MMSVANFLLEIIPVNNVRLIILRILGVKLGRGVIVERGVRFDFPWRLTIGDKCYISKSAYLDCRGGRILIGDQSDISEGATIYTLSHDINSDDFSTKADDVIIGNRNWICAHTIILPGARLGVGCVVAANSVFSGVAPNFTLLGGVPAKLIKKLNPDRASRVRC